MLAVLLSVMHEAANMASIQDQLAAQIDCADVCAMLSAGRKRHLLLSEVIRVLGLRGAGGNSEMLRRACDALGSHLIATAEEISFTQVCGSNVTLNCRYNHGLVGSFKCRSTTVLSQLIHSHDGNEQGPFQSMLL